MAATSEPNPYLRTKVMTAGPAELRLMLFDGALKFAEQGRQGLTEKNYELAFTGISRCQQILAELIVSLDPKQAPELCERLSGLYTFMMTRLMAASHERDPAIVAEVITLLEYERETWIMLLEKLAAEVAAAGNMTQTPDQTPDQTPGHTLGQTPLPDGDATAPGLIGGRVSLQG